MILVVGATGTVGSEVVRQLRAAGHAVRALVHSPEKAGRVGAPGVEAVVGDLAKPETLRPALTGVDHVFVAVPTGAVPHEATLAAEAKRAGAQHLVKLSVMGADAEPGVALGRVHRGSERKIEESGIGHTFVRPTSFMSNFLNQTATIRAQGALYAPVGDGKLAFIDVRDIAAVVVAALTNPGHMGKAYSLTGPEALSHARVAEKLSAATGRKITFVDVSPDVTRKAMIDMSMPAPFVDAVLEYYGMVKQGRAAAVTNDIERITGRKPRSFDAWATENAAAFR